MHHRRLGWARPTDGELAAPERQGQPLGGVFGGQQQGLSFRLAMGVVEDGELAEDHAQTHPEDFITVSRGCIHPRRVKLAHPPQVESASL